MSDLAVRDDVRARPAGLRAHADTSTIFVLGVLSLSGSFIFGGCAWYFGNRLLRKYDAQPGRWGHRVWVEAGRILGMIGTGISAVFWLLLLLAFAL